MLDKIWKLKQLREVQSQIKNCTATIASLKVPTPTSVKIQSDMMRWISSLVCDDNPDISLILQASFYGLEDETLDYLHQLGEYFINVTDYYKAEKRYKAELTQLQTKERNLKAKLGID